MNPDQDNKSPNLATTPELHSARDQWILHAINAVEKNINAVEKNMADKFLNLDDKLKNLPTEDRVRNIIENAINNSIENLEKNYTTKKWIYEKSWVALISIATLILLAANLYFRWV